MNVWVAVLTAGIGVVGGGVVTFATTRSQLRIEAEHAYDRALRDLRLPHYQELFHLTRSIPRERLGVDVPRRAEVMDLRGRFHDWYFNEQASGMFLSQPSRLVYFGLMDELEAIQARLTLDSEPVSDRDVVLLRDRAGALRHRLTADLGAAESPRRSWVEPRSVVAEPRPGP